MAERGIMQGFAVLLTVLAGLCVTALLLPHQMTYVEGYMLEQAHRLAFGDGLYLDPASPPWIVDNFPPAWIAVLAVGVRLFGPSFAFGRLLTMLSVAALAWMLWSLQRRRGEVRWLALAVLALWLMSPFVVRRMLFARMDFPALALMAAGFVALVAARRWSVVVASLAFAAAVLCRQTALVAPAAAFLGLVWAGQKRSAALLAVVTGSVVLGAVGILQHVTDGRFLTDVVLHNTGRWSFLRMMRYTGYFLGGHILIILLGLAGALRMPRDTLQAKLILGWLALQVATIWTIGKPGTASNHFLPLLFTLALTAAYGLRLVVREFPRIRLDRAAAGAMAVQALVLAVPFGMGIAHIVTGQDDEARLVALLEDTPGPVLSENAGAVLQSGHEVLLEPRTTLEQWEAGRWDDGPLREAVAAQDFTVIVTETFPDYRSAFAGMRFTPAVWEAIHTHYEPAELLGRWQVWRPVEPAALPPEAAS